MKRFWTQFAIVFGAWTVLGLLLAFNSYLVRIPLGEPVPFHKVLVRPLLEHWIWAALTPLVFLLVRRFPFSRERILRTILAHVSFSVLVCILHIGASQLLDVPMGLMAKEYQPYYKGATFKLRLHLELYSDMWMYWTLVFVKNMIEYYKRFREREIKAAQLEAKLAKSQLELLRTQLQPHFLFNTLNSISALMEEDVEAAEDMLADLSYMLRESLQGGASQEISLRQEVDLIAAYLRIQQRRFEDRLTVTTEIAEEAWVAKVPSFLLQPLVENAIRHGIAPLARKGHIEIRAFVSGDRLLVRVSDNGAGLPPNSREGIGLSNTRQRLAQLYGQAQSLDLATRSEGGVTVGIAIPFHTIPAQEERAGGEVLQARNTVSAQ